MSLFNKIYLNWVVIMARGTFCHTMFSGHVRFILFDLLPHWTHCLVQNLVSSSGSKNCDYRPVITFFLCHLGKYQHWRSRHAHSTWCSSLIFLQGDVDECKGKKWSTAWAVSAVLSQIMPYSQCPIENSFRKIAYRARYVWQTLSLQYYFLKRKHKKQACMIFGFHSIAASSNVTSQHC